MTKLNNLLDKLADNQRVQSNLERARDKYSEKPYVVEYLELYDTLNKIWWLPSLYSVGGVLLLFICLLSNIYLAIVSGLFVGLLVEGIKHPLSQKAFSSYFRKRRGATLLLIGTICIYLVSVGLSSWGAYEGFKLLESDKVGTATATHQNAVDSLNNYYQATISNKQKQVDDFVNQYSIRHGVDKGRIDWSMRKQHTALLNQLETLKEHHRQDIRQLEGQKVGIAQTASNSVAGYLYLCVGISVLMELIIFFIARFLEYYDFKSNHQIELIENSQQYTVNLNTLSAITQMMQGNGQLSLAAIASNQNGKAMGFKIGSGQPPKNTAPDDKPASQPADKLKDGQKVCENCKQVYTPKVSWQKFCNKSCNHEFNGFNLKK